METERKTVLSYLAEGWEEAAKSEGAIQRNRNIKTAEDLLTLNLLYLTKGGSYHTTSVLMRLSTGVKVNKEATRKRIMSSGNWLRWMGQRLCVERGYIEEKPQWLGERRVILTDGTDMALRGSSTNDYRLHTAFDLFSFTCVQMELTGIAEGGERLSRYAVRPADILIGDRVYGMINGMEHVREAGGSYVLRLRSNAFTLYDARGEKMELLPWLRKTDPWQPVWTDCFYKDGRGMLHPVRIVATRKDEDASREAHKKLKRKTSRQQKSLHAQRQEMANYIVLATNLPDSAERVLELYRARWQIELVFHRLKGLFSLGEPPGTNPDSVRAWFYGKLFLAALCEAMTKTASFPPARDASFLP